MLKSFAHLCCAIMLVSLLAGCNGEQKPVIGVVDLTAVQSNSLLMVKVSEHLEKHRGTLMAQALEVENTFKENESDETREAYLAAVDGFEAAVAAEEERIFTALSDGIDKLLTEYRQANGFAVLLVKDTVLSYDKAIDVTEGVTAALDKLELDFEGTANAEVPAEVPAEEAAEKSE